MNLDVRAFSKGLTRRIDAPPEQANGRAALAWLGTPPALGALAVIAFGLVVRIFILTHYLGGLDGDEATTGLVARHAVYQHEFPVFYWSSNYGGTLEAFVTGAVFAIVGSSVIALKAVAIGWYAVACVLTWRVGRRLVDARVGAVAALLLWVWPASYVWWSTKSRGFYGSLLVLGLLVALTVLRIAERPERRADWLGLGFVLGMGWWVQPQIAVLAIPVGGWLVVKRGRALTLAWMAVPTALLGAAPWILWNIRHRLNSFDVPPQPASAPYVTRFARFWTEGLPMATGLRVPYAMRWIEPYAAPLYPVLGFAVAALIIKRYRGTGLLLIATIVISAAFYALNPLTVHSVEGRYVFLLAPIIAIILSACLRWRWLPVPALVGAMILTALGLSAMHDGNAFFSGDKLIPNDIRPLISALNEEQIRTAVADYGIAYRVTFESDERIIVAGAPYDRYPPYVKALSSGPPPAWLAVEGSTGDRNLRQALDARLEPYRRRTAGGFSIYMTANRFVPGQLPTT